MSVVVYSVEYRVILQQLSCVNRHSLHLVENNPITCFVEFDVTQLRV